MIVWMDWWMRLTRVSIHRKIHLLCVGICIHRAGKEIFFSSHQQLMRHPFLFLLLCAISSSSLTGSECPIVVPPSNRRTALTKGCFPFFGRKRNKHLPLYSIHIHCFSEIKFNPFFCLLCIILQPNIFWMELDKRMQII